MSDFDENGRREPDWDEIRDAHEERKRNRPVWRCICDRDYTMPGHCPGPSCPYAQDAA